MADLSLQDAKNRFSAVVDAALEHGLTLITRNVRHFESAAVPTLNPFDDREGPPV